MTEPKKVTMTIYLCRTKYDSWVPFNADPRECGLGADYIIHAQQEVTFHLTRTDEEILAERITALRKEQDRIRAEAEHRWQTVEDTINSLIALPNLSTPQGDNDVSL